MLSRNRWLSALLLSLVAVLLVVGCGGDDDESADGGGGAAAADQTLKWGLGSEFLLDPGLATDTTSSKILSNILDGLVKLNDDLEAEAAAAESWEENGKVITFTLREGMTWTNGDPVTAADYEFAWKRALSPELGSDYAYQLTGIQGAAEYNECESNCNAARDKVMIEATDDRTLKVTLDLGPAVVHRAGGAPRLPAREPEGRPAVR